MADQSQLFNVVVNEEGQYSIWPVHRDLPLGWHIEGTQGTKAECLSYIGDVWTDMRPRTARSEE